MTHLTLVLNLLNYQDFFHFLETNRDWLLQEKEFDQEKKTSRTREKQERKKERKKKNCLVFTMDSSKNLIKHMYHQDLLVLSLRRIKEQEKRKRKQGKQARKRNW